MPRLLLLWIFLCFGVSVFAQTQDVYINAGFRKMDEGDYDLALLYLNKAVSLNPKLAKGYYQRALLKTRQGEFKKAMADLDTAQQKEPGYTPIHFLRSKIYHAINQNEMAQREISRYIHENPRDLAGYEWKIELHKKENADRSALITAGDMVENNPDMVLAWKTRGLLREAALDAPGALQDFDRCLEINASDSVCLYKRAGLRFFSGNMKGAADDYKRFLTKYPDYPDAWINLSEARVILKDTAGAVAALDTAMMFSENNVNLFMTRGYYLMTLKRYELAEADYTAALMMPSDEKPVAWFNRGLCFHYMGKKAEACHDWQLASEANPPIEDAKKWIQKHCK
jgi:tetratricopeptide (TPR) repeat protein